MTIGKVLTINQEGTSCIDFSVGDFTFGTNRFYDTPEEAEEVLTILRRAWSAGYMECQRTVRVAMGVNSPPDT